MRSILLLFVMCAALMCCTHVAYAIPDSVLLDMEFEDDVTYYILLENGDILSGPITEVEQDKEGVFVRIGAVIGRAKVYAKEISWISSSDDSYRHRHRGFIMPTAQPIRGDHYLGLIEGVMPYLGIGISDWLSLSGGRTIIPGLNWSEQISNVDVKFTVHESENGLVAEGHQYYAFGVNGGWLNDVNFFGHVYGVATFTGKRTQVSTMLFAKVAGKDVYTITASNFFAPVTFNFENGTIGLAIGLDTRFPDMRELHFVSELWNSDITRPSNTAWYLGLRLANTSVAMDFGFTITPGPAVAPTVCFAWTPF